MAALKAERVLLANEHKELQAERATWEDERAALGAWRAQQDAKRLLASQGISTKGKTAQGKGAVGSGGAATAPKGRGSGKAKAKGNGKGGKSKWGSSLGSPDTRMAVGDDGVAAEDGGERPAWQMREEPDADVTPAPKRARGSPAAAGPKAANAGPADGGSGGAGAARQDAGGAADEDKEQEEANSDNNKASGGDEEEPLVSSPKVSPLQTLMYEFFATRLRDGRKLSEVREAWQADHPEAEGVVISVDVMRDARQYFMKYGRKEAGHTHVSAKSQWEKLKGPARKEYAAKLAEHSKIMWAMVHVADPALAPLTLKEMPPVSIKQMLQLAAGGAADEAPLGDAKGDAPSDDVA